MNTDKKVLTIYSTWGDVGVGVKYLVCAYLTAKVITGNQGKQNNMVLDV